MKPRWVTCCFRHGELLCCMVYIGIHTHILSLNRVIILICFVDHTYIRFKFLLLPYTLSRWNFHCTQSCVICSLGNPGHIYTLWLPGVKLSLFYTISSLSVFVEFEKNLGAGRVRYSGGKKISPALWLVLLKSILYIHGVWSLSTFRAL